MINLEEFTKKLEAEIEELEPGTLTPNVKYKELETWSSMYALIVIAFIDSEFGLTLNGEDLKSCETVNDLYELVKSRL